MADEQDEFRRKFEEAITPISDWPIMGKDTAKKNEAITKYINIFMFLRKTYPEFPGEKVQWKMDQVTQMMEMADVMVLLPNLREETLLPKEGEEDELCVLAMDTKDIAECIEGCDKDAVERFTFFVYMLTSSILAPSIRES